MICNLIPFPLLPVFSSTFSNGTENVALNIWWRPLGLPQKCYEHHFIMPLKKIGRSQRDTIMQLQRNVQFGEKWVALQR